MIHRAIWTTTYLCLLVFLSAQQLSAAEDTATRVRQATVRIEVRDQANNILGRGSGVAVSPQGYILTAYHVIREYYKDPGNIKIFVRRVDSNQTLQNENRVSVVSSDTNVDMAILHLPGENFPFLKVGPSSGVAIDAKLTAYGFGGGGESVLAKFGHRSGNAWEVDIPLSEGFSGGPVVLEGCDVLIGIVSGGLVGADGMIIPGRSIMVPSQYGAHLMAKADAAKTNLLCSKLKQLTWTSRSPFAATGISPYSLDNCPCLRINAPSSFPAQQGDVVSVKNNCTQEVSMLAMRGKSGPTPGFQIFSEHPRKEFSTFILFPGEEENFDIFGYSGMAFSPMESCQ